MTREQATVFGESVLEALGGTPFGALPKSELDLLIFAGLVDAEVVRLNAPVFDTARRLEITPARVRSFLYRYRLEHQHADEGRMADIASALSRTRFTLTTDYVVFGVEDPYIRDSLAALLKEQGIFADSSFNPETVRLSLDAFVDFADARLADDDRRAILRALEEDTKVELNAFKRVVKAALTQLGGRVLGAAAQEVSTGLVDAAWEFTTGVLRGDSKQVARASSALL